MDAITLQTRQLVNWPPAPTGVAQVDELLRTRVRLFYRTKTGRDRRPLVSAVRLTPRSDYLLDNVFLRAVPKRSKEFKGGRSC